jgi:hypothetical protein
MYKQLTKTEASDLISTIEGLTSDFLNNSAGALDFHDRFYIEHSQPRSMILVPISI